VTRDEYLEKWRELIKTLNDRELGICILGRIGKLGWKDPYATVTNKELDNVLYPKEGSNFNYTKPTIDFIKKRIQSDESHLVFSSNRTKKKFDSFILAIGQRTRALLNGDKVEHENLINEELMILGKSLKQTEINIIRLKAELLIEEEKYAKLQNKISDLEHSKIL
jgi:hypothetical protein